MTKTNSVEIKSFEVISATIEVIGAQTGSKSIIRKYYSIGYKKNGNKYFKITGIPEFYKTHAEILAKDAILISFTIHEGDQITIRTSKKVGMEAITCKSDSINVMFYQQNADKSIDWIDAMDSVEITIHRPKLIELKVLPEYFAAQEDGVKNFEIRKNDRGYQVDDLLLLKEYDPEKEQYTGRFLRRKITYITSYKQQEGYVVLGTKKI
ncbi:DUF3850 domain-containing protein [Limosilactobacillus reuteri]|nr:DUF3850 domain-containing protein [Limosilactobacillus reuteri]MCC4371873.1 DUF3850 domain-containing protein [Limosilactobacillus reuteri]